MNNKKPNAENNRKSSPGKCVQCAFMLAILRALEIDVETPQECDMTSEDDVRKMKSRKEVLALLNIDPSTYCRWIKWGILTPRIFGNRHYYRDEDLKRGLEESARRGKR